MKFLLPLLLITTLSFGQNGGQYPENGSVKLEYVGNGKTKVWNKQSCTSVIRVDYNSSVNHFSVAPNSFYLLNTPVSGLIKAKNETNCGCPDYGQVELLITPNLPVKFVSFTTTPIGKNQIKVDFEIAEATNVKQFNIQVSTDGVNWETVAVVLPDNFQPNRKYSKTITLLAK